MSQYIREVIFPGNKVLFDLNVEVQILDRCQNRRIRISENIQKGHNKYQSDTDKSVVSAFLSLVRKIRSTKALVRTHI